MQTELHQEIKEHKEPKYGMKIEEEDHERSDDDLDEDKGRTGFRAGNASETNSFRLGSDQSMKNIKSILKGRLASATTNLNRNLYKRGAQT